jgi:hypothetical protein
MIFPASVSQRPTVTSFYRSRRIASTVDFLRSFLYPKQRPGPCRQYMAFFPSAQPYFQASGTEVRRQSIKCVRHGKPPGRGAAIKKRNSVNNRCCPAASRRYQRRAELHEEASDRLCAKRDLASDARMVLLAPPTSSYTACRRHRDMSVMALWCFAQ